MVDIISVVSSTSHLKKIKTNMTTCIHTYVKKIKTNMTTCIHTYVKKIKTNMTTCIHTYVCVFPRQGHNQ